MEWVETTGKSIEEAKDLALDQLGVDSAEAEFEIVEEPKSGLFGRTRGEARVRARLVPLTPPPKTERRRKTNSRRQGEGDQRRGRQGGQKATTEGSSDSAEPQRAKSEASSAGTGQSSGQEADGRATRRPPRDKVDREPMDGSEQVTTLESFLRELIGSFGLEATVAATLDGNELRANVTGDGLGLLVGPRLATLDAIQEVARHALQRQAAGREYAKVIVDVSDIRERRRDALVEFVQQAAERVKDEDVEVVFDVMSSVDRKQVHDLVTTIDGVESASEGEDPRRRVVIRAVS